MTHWLSKPVERLLQDERYPFTEPGNRQTHQIDTDVLVVGSGYGAAMAALALLEPDQDGEQLTDKVWVFECGKEYVPGDFPGNLSELPAEVGSGKLNSQGLWDVRLGDNVVTISGRGLGGTSLVNANVAARPAAGVLDQWPGAGTLTSGRWHTELMAVIPRIEKLLGVSRHPGASSKLSYQSLGRSAAAMGGEVEPAPLTVNFAGPTPHSAKHAPCNGCGNCVTGCHSGAKGSLNMNAWPLARQLGAELFTGVVVSYLSRQDNGRWQVHCQVAGQPDQCFRVNCKTVILGAGTLGSTEILMRSRDRAGLSLSPTLGRRFSTNGDALVFGIGQKHPASHKTPFPGPDIIASDAVGPTISGMASVSIDERAPSVTMEDAVIPHALQDVWQEMIVSQALLRCFGDGQLSHWHQQHPAHDLLARSDHLASHSQTLLIMGHDEGEGSLVWQDDALRPSWPGHQAGTEGSSYYAKLDRTLQRHEAVAFDAGLYSPNILSQPLPAAFQNVVEGADALKGLALSVHPLGGCSMGETAETGVVNASGAVFSASESDSAVWDGLYVVDGAILPGPVGTNPFLTIASLSFCLGRKLREKLVGKALRFERQFPVLDEAFREVPPGSPRQLKSASDRKVEAKFSERLVMHLDDSKRSFLPWSRRGRHPPIARLKAITGLPDLASDAKALVLDVSFFFADDNSLDRWLQQPAAPLNAQATLSSDSTGSILTTHDRDLTPLTTLTGTVELGVPVQQGSIRRSLGIGSALLRYLRYRGLDLLCRIPALPARLLLPEKAWQTRFGKASTSSRPKTNKSLLAEIKGFVRIAALQAQPRVLKYQFVSEHGVQWRGEKTLCYRLGADDLLRALMVLPVTIKRSHKSERAVLELDGQRISQGPAPLQITRSPDLPTSVMAVASFGMYALRLIMKTHFWSFAAPDYDQFAKRRTIESSQKQGRYYEPPEMIFYGQAGEHRSLPREKFENAELVNGKPVPVARLVRYQPSHGGTGNRRSILLIHGLAHSSRVFWTDTITCNYTQYFLNQNYDVWILDHRVSANYVREIDPAHTWEQIAHRDVPWAVKTAFNQSNRLSLPGQEKGIHVFAHCIGAGAISMSALNGDLDYEYRTVDGKLGRRSMLASLVPHAVTPWLTASAENRVRANIWALVKEFEPIKIIEPLPYRDPEALELIYDRLAALAVSREENRQWRWFYGFRDWRGPGFARSIYTRYTIFWGRQWWNRNISRKTRREFSGMIGPVPIGVMQQVYFSMTRGLLASREGNNDFVRSDNFSRYWTFPTLFLHGNRNTVFDMASSRHSADQLTRQRIYQRTGVLPVGKLSPNQYARENVWIEMLDDYGHMDMIFSKRVHVDVLPKLHRFFQAVEKQAVTETYENPQLSDQALQNFWSTAGSEQRQYPLTRPKAGPIISRPICQSEDQLALTVWVEEEDFSAMNALALVGDRVLQKNDVSPLPSTAYSQQEFWLGQVMLHPTTGTTRWAFSHATEGEAFPAPKQDSVLMNLQGLDWVKRLQEQGRKSGCSSTGEDSLTGEASLPGEASSTGEASSPGDKLRLLIGSCFYPGTPFDREVAQQVFTGMYRHVRPSADDDWRGVDAIVLLGDQIYADATADLFDPKTRYERYRNPYQLALANDAARQLFSHVPSYFSVDDHEYRDNWRGELQGDLTEFHYARQMAALFQRHEQPADQPSDQPRLWYDFTCLGCPFFVIDSRFQRVTQPETDREMRLLDDEQWQALERWLLKQADEPVIFLVSGSPIAPVSRDICRFPELAVNDDSLLAYPAFLSRLTDIVTRNEVSGHLVWLCGDPHFSCTADLSLTSANGNMMKLTQVCSSGLYAPIPFANANPAGYDWCTAFEVTLSHHGQGNAVTVSGQQQLLCDASQHFTRLVLHCDQGKATLELSCHDGAGEPLTHKVTLNLS